MRALFRRWFGFQPVSLPQEMRSLWGTTQTARVIYEKPERDSEKPGCVHEWSDSDVMALELQRERERTAASKVVQIRKR